MTHFTIILLGRDAAKAKHSEIDRARIWQRRDTCVARGVSARNDAGRRRGAPAHTIPLRRYNTAEIDVRFHERMLFVFVVEFLFYMNSTADR